MLEIKDIRSCDTAFTFWTNNALSKTIENLLGDCIVSKTVEGKNKIVFVVKAQGKNSMVETIYRKFLPLQKRIEILK